MRQRFQWIAESQPAHKWRRIFDRTWPSYSRWFLLEGNRARPTLADCRNALTQHMPELLPMWERLVALSEGGDQAARLLSLYRPTPYMSGCSQAVWSRPAPLLVRNYDYHPAACEGVFLLSSWHGVKVLASSDCLWGALDGVNDRGLVVSLAFGGRRIVGDGFGIPLVLRYVLEFCRDVQDAVSVLVRIPSHMAYNVSLLDSTGAHVVVYVSPDRPASVLPHAIATNHQHAVEWTRHDELTRSAERLEHLTGLLDDSLLTTDELTNAFLRDPLYSSRHDQGFGTLYTVAYDPARKHARYLWPHGAIEQSIDEFVETEWMVNHPRRA